MKRYFPPAARGSSGRGAAAPPPPSIVPESSTTSECFPHHQRPSSPRRLVWLGIVHAAGTEARPTPGSSLKPPAPTDARTLWSGVGRASVPAEEADICLRRFQKSLYR